jgi:hypothetical protein
MFKPYAKAIVAVLCTGLAAAGAAIADGITPAEWLGIIGAAVAAGGAVWGTPWMPAESDQRTMNTVGT